MVIEFKAETNKGNAYNRAVEAEKSDVRAHRSRFRECWTVITVGIPLS